MAIATLNISVDIPSSYEVEVLQKQLTEYAVYLIKLGMPHSEERRHYRHEALRGVIPQEKREGEYLEEYLKEKYGV
jgi:CRISPR/Cas system-associated exonuclease Cas4 (RecB family)